MCVGGWGVELHVLGGFEGLTLVFDSLHVFVFKAIKGSLKPCLKPRSEGKVNFNALVLNV